MKSPFPVRTVTKTSGFLSISCQADVTFSYHPGRSESFDGTDFESARQALVYKSSGPQSVSAIQTFEGEDRLTELKVQRILLLWLVLQSRKL